MAKGAGGAPRAGATPRSRVGEQVGREMSAAVHAVRRRAPRQRGRCGQRRDEPPVRRHPLARPQRPAGALVGQPRLGHHQVAELSSPSAPRTSRPAPPPQPEIDSSSSTIARSARPSPCSGWSSARRRRRAGVAPEAPAAVELPRLGEQTWASVSARPGSPGSSARAASGAVGWSGRACLGAPYDRGMAKKKNQSRADSGPSGGSTRRSSRRRPASGCRSSSTSSPRRPGACAVPWTTCGRRPPSGRSRRCAYDVARAHAPGIAALEPSSKADKPKPAAR